MQDSFRAVLRNGSRASRSGSPSISQSLCVTSESPTGPGREREREIRVRDKFRCGGGKATRRQRPMVGRNPPSALFWGDSARSGSAGPRRRPWRRCLQARCLKRRKTEAEWRRMPPPLDTVTNERDTGRQRWIGVGWALCCWRVTGLSCELVVAAPFPSLPHRGYGGEGDCPWCFSVAVSLTLQRGRASTRRPAPRPSLPSTRLASSPVFISAEEVMKTIKTRQGEWRERESS